ncbi:uncharacterized protein DNG_04266 [Cephalotrichum gorgonifer]|uniref:Uncharacterized protein n=1 Tax=Cephalotrichum gorgonifer TaxID=2041049 RepID=A0AAE8MXN1_9PEZI|nr:uncharacterized protein DNG_04266 [Cephalotrichum gorgonifer]
MKGAVQRVMLYGQACYTRVLEEANTGDGLRLSRGLVSDMNVLAFLENSLLDAANILCQPVGASEAEAQGILASSALSLQKIAALQALWGMMPPPTDAEKADRAATVMGVYFQPPGHETAREIRELLTAIDDESLRPLVLTNEAREFRLDKVAPSWFQQLQSAPRELLFALNKHFTAMVPSREDACGSRGTTDQTGPKDTTHGLAGIQQMDKENGPVSGGSLGCGSATESGTLRMQVEEAKAEAARRQRRVDRASRRALTAARQAGRKENGA